MREVALGEHERLDDLMRSGRKIIQNTREFCFSLDAVLLAHFPRYRSRQRVLELGTGKGDFISQLAELHPDINYIGIEMQQDVLYSAAKKIAERELKNVRLLVFDINHIEDIFAEGEVDRFYINFCDPWPKKRHAKRRLTHVGFLEKYRRLLKKPGELHFKTDNRPLFDFSLEQFEEAGLRVQDVSYDLHAENRPDNIMTEYERKFSGFGEKINRCEVIFE